MKQSLLIFLTLIISRSCTVPQAMAIEKPESGSPSGQIVNRSVLTVGRLAFTALDAYAVLMVWNSSLKDKSSMIKIQMDWLNPHEIGRGHQNALNSPFESWPSDVRQFFTVALVWADVQKLNLFIPKSDELKNGIEAFDDYFKSNSNSIPQGIRDQISRAKPKQRQQWVEMVLRTRSFLRIRGAFERNKNLMDVGWYWHTAPKAGER